MLKRFSYTFPRQPIESPKPRNRSNRVLGSTILQRMIPLMGISGSAIKTLPLNRWNLKTRSDWQ